MYKYSKLPLAEAEYRYNNGLLSEKDFYQYIFVWIWTTARFSNNFSASDKQDKFYTIHGREAFYRRINRVRKICGFKPLTVGA